MVAVCCFFMVFVLLVLQYILWRNHNNFLNSSTLGNAFFISSGSSSAVLYLATPIGVENRPMTLDDLI